MKTISSRFLKGALSILLVVVMLFGSTISGFAAVVDNANTKANVDVAGTCYDFSADTKIYFDSSDLGWPADYKVEFMVGHSNWSATYEMTKISNTNLYYLNHPSWGGATEYCIIANSSAWGDEGNSPSHRRGYASYKTSLVTMDGNYSGTFQMYNSSDTLTPEYLGDNSGSYYDLLDKTQKAIVYSAASGSSTYSEDAEAGTVMISGYQLSDASTATYTSTSSTSSNSTAAVAIARSSNVTLTATPSAGYEFIGWYSDANGDTLVSTDTTYTYRQLGEEKTYYARFEEAGYSYTVTAGTGGTVSPTSGTATSATITATPGTGYAFDKWTVTGNGSVANASNASTTLTINANGVIAHATFKKLTYTVKYDVGDGTGTFADQTKTHGESLTLHSATPTPPAKYIFSGWSDGSGNVYQAGNPYEVDANVTLTAQYEKNEFTATFKDYDGTVLDTQEVTKNNTPDAPEVSDRTGYIFAGWDPEVGAMTSDKTFTATYTPIEYTITFNTAGGSSIASTTYTIESPDFELPTPTKTGFAFDKWVDSGGNEYSTIETGSYGNLELTAVYTQLYYAIVAGNTATANDYYEVGETVTLTFDVETGKYLTGVTVAPAMELDVDIDKSTGKVTFIMPAQDVTLTPTFGVAYTVTFNPDVFSSTDKKDYYYPGEEVTINVTPRGGHLITGITSEQTEVSYANKVITFVMPAENVTLDVEYSASFKAYSRVTTVHIDPDGPNVHTGYDNRVQGGTVTMTCNGDTLAEGGYVDGDVTYTASVNSGYEFVGFFGDAECNKLLSADTTYTVSPESDITVYALYARTQYIKVGNASSTNIFYQMKYDYKLKAYTMVYTNNDPVDIGTAPIGTTFNNGFDIVVSYQNSGQPYVGWGSADFSLSMNGNSYGRSMSWGQDVWHVDGKQDNTELPLTIIVKPESITKHNKIDVSARAVKNGATIYLSSGWKDMPNELNPTSAFTSTVTGATTTNLSHNINNVYYDTESYVKATISSAQQVTFKTTLSGSDAANYYVDSFVVYDIYDGTYTIVEPNSSGNNVYEGTVYVDHDCYIVPIFFHTEEYVASQTGYKTIELYFDATSIQGTSWGPFVSAYAYGDDWYTGVWTGQMMIPTEDGSSWYTQITVPETGLSGIVFNNYLFDTCPHKNAGAFGVSGTNLQTYDYREALTLYELEYDVITFVAKTSKDGYHGNDRNHSAGVTTDYYVTTTTNALDGKYVFDYLYSRDGVTPMDLNAEKIENVTKSYDANGSVNNAEYYIISSGDQHYDDTHYSEDSNYDGEWSVEWYVFDDVGNYITKVLSDGFYNDKDKDGDTYLIEQLKSQGYTNIDQAVVAISYEAPNQGAGDTQISYDGQWYGNMLDDTVNGQVIVGLDDGNGNFTIDEVDPTNDADYGSGYLKDLEGNLHQTLDIKIDYGIADLTASAKTGYRFIGWYTKKADGTYVEISKNTAYSTYINMDTTYYAIFRELGEKEVVINHRKYVNPDDPAIMSHDGVGEMSIEVKDSDENVVATGPINTASTSAAFTADEGKTYTIKITTTPLMNGKFFAWYTDSFKADGTKTYEEVLTEDKHRDSPSTVYAEFEYTYDSTDPTLQTNITIYSDIKRVSNKATIIYSYLNRFNAPCTYTIKDVPLSDEECLGFAGNNNKPYVPAYYTLLTYPNGTEKYVLPEDVSKESGYSGSYNKIQSYAPDANVTEAFNDQIRWVIESDYITAEESIVRVKAVQDAPDYTVTYTMPDENGDNVTNSESGEYNTLMKITAPPTDKEGDEFSYWYEPATGEILCYTPYYNYMIVENKTIVAVYGAEVTQEWSPSINSVTYTREFSDDNDFVYTDYLLAFNNIDSKILTEVYNDENIKYGLLVYRDANYYIENKDNITYPEFNATVEDYLKRTARDKEQNMAFPVGNTMYNCYYYNLTGNDLTIFNRCDYFVRYYNDYEVAPGKYYRDYALTAVAYIIVGDEVYLSNPKNVNFYELGNMPVTGSGNN